MDSAPGRIVISLFRAVNTFEGIELLNLESRL